MANVKFDIEKHIGVIAEKSRGWNRELNIVSWNGGEAKYDIRDWDESHEKMSKGITFTEDEGVALLTLLKEELL